MFVNDFLFYLCRCIFFYKFNDDYILIVFLNLNEVKSVFIDFCWRGRGVKIL